MSGAAAIAPSEAWTIADEGSVVASDALLVVSAAFGTIGGGKVSVRVEKLSVGAGVSVNLLSEHTDSAGASVSFAAVTVDCAPVVSIFGGVTAAPAGAEVEFVRVTVNSAGVTMNSAGVTAVRLSADVVRSGVTVDSPGGVL